METNQVLFSETQYSGTNRHSLMRRLVLAVFCFVAYYWSEHPEPVDLDFFQLGEYPGEDYSGKIFFLLGLVILIVSVVLMFVKHFTTTVHSGAIYLESLWTSRKVRIDVNSIESIRKIILKASVLNRPVYNLHTSGKIRFYTHGHEAVELVMNDGLIYRIGTQRAGELVQLLRNMKKNVNEGN
jgi:hypothetical protein